MGEDQDMAGAIAIELATDLTIAWLKNADGHISAEEAPAFLRKIHSTISELSDGGKAAASADEEHKPAVPVRSSIKPDYLVSLIDGRKFKSLKRHLGLHGLTPAEYRQRYGLKPDYPMVAPDYSARRREVAKKLGLGKKRSASPGAPAKPEPGTTARKDGAKPKLKLKLPTAAN
ncbi:MucR family transcriptional regulator [Sphingomonadaceae bacterium G21617-S1]|nr:MucR family transcriptional regulator [Sphingomonadaceae bacterium G21617-S1]